MTLRSASRDRQQADTPWHWMLTIRQMLLDRIQTLTTECDDPRELTDAAALLARINRKIQARNLD